MTRNFEELNKRYQLAVCNGLLKYYQYKWPNHPNSKLIKRLLEGEK